MFKSLAQFIFTFLFCHCREICRKQENFFTDTTLFSKISLLEKVVLESLPQWKFNVIMYFSELMFRIFTLEVLFMLNNQDSRYTFPYSVFLKFYILVILIFHSCFNITMTCCPGTGL